MTRLDRHKRGGPIPDPFTRGSGWAKAPVQNADGRSFAVLVNVLEVAPLAGHVRRFDPKNYEGYEFIDFR